MKFINKIKQIAKLKNATILLPEANENRRVYLACKQILKLNLTKIAVLGDSSEFDSDFKCANCLIINPKTYANKQNLTLELYKLRKDKGLTKQQANELINNKAYFATMLLKTGVVDGMVAGASWTTADTLRPALQIIKTKPNKSFVTGAMLMLKEGSKPLVFADVSLVENPNSEQLAEIAISAAEFYKNLTKNTAKVAMLSYSTRGSAQSEMVEKVKNAVKIAQDKSQFLIDGEMQVDAALNTKVAKHKGVNGKVGGNANVLIFPDLNAGNIAYKLVSRLGGYAAVGPIMLNFNKPVNDLSRGCTVTEIVNTVLITKILIDF